MSRDYRFQYWTAVLGGPPILAAVLLGTAVHHRRTRKNMTR